MAHLCELCHKPVILVPSAEERAKKYGGTAEYYTSLFKVHNRCQLDANIAAQLEVTRRLVNDNKKSTS